MRLMDHCQVTAVVVRCVLVLRGRCRQFHGQLRIEQISGKGLRRWRWCRFVFTGGGIWVEVLRLRGKPAVRGVVCSNLTKAFFQTWPFRIWNSVQERFDCRAILARLNCPQRCFKLLGESIY